MSVLVAIPTYRRAEALSRLLESLPAAVDDVEDEVHALVLDNDSDPAIESLVLGHPAAARVRLEYAAAPEAGIPAVRNAALRAARGHDHLAFVDDDEELLPGWLHSHLAALARFEADVVAGPVLPRAPDTRPPWLSDLSVYLFDAPKLPLGARLPWCATNNTVVRTAVLGGIRFDERYTASGGSDTHFFFRVARTGARIVWNPDAPVVTLLPHDRLRLWWLLRRAFRSGAVQSKVQLHVVGPGPWIARHLVKAGGNVGLGLSSLTTGTVRGSRATALQGMQRIARGLGLFAGLFGVTGREYGGARQRS